MIKFDYNSISQLQTEVQISLACIYNNFILTSIITFVTIKITWFNTVKSLIDLTWVIIFILKGAINFFLMFNILVSVLNTMLFSEPIKALLTQFFWVSSTSEENIINSETILKLILWTSLFHYPGAVPFSSNKISSSLMKFLLALAILKSNSKKII